jgi:polyketide synthase Type III
MSVESPNAYIHSVASAFPETSFTQEEVGQHLGINHPVVKRLLRAPHIKKRHVYLPPIDPATGIAQVETPGQLNNKFREKSRHLGTQAVLNALVFAGISKDDIDYLLCITSTGFMVPGLSSLLSRELDLRPNLQRADIVGMGCNAGLNGLNLLTQWVKANPTKTGLLVCCEINSASYVIDDTVRTGIVNSLFGDGAAAVILSGKDTNASKHGSATWNQPKPRILDFESFCLAEKWDAMRFDYDEIHNKFSFFLSPDIPYTIGFNIHRPLEALLARNGLTKSNIRHWIIHTGGAAVIESVKLKLGLEENDVRHTRSVLRDYGNISSGSFLVTLERHLKEEKIDSGDFVVMLTMGPGAQIESALLRF